MLDLNPCPVCGKSRTNTITISDLIDFRGQAFKWVTPLYKSRLICKDQKTHKVIFDSRLNIRPVEMTKFSGFIVDAMWAEIVPCLSFGKYITSHEAAMICLVHDPNEKGEANEKIAERPV